MQKNNIKKNFRKVIIFLVLLIFIMLLLIGILTAINRNKERTGEYVRPQTIKPMFSDNFFKNYNGQNSKEQILDKLTEFIYYIMDNKQEIDNLNEEGLLSLYNQNEKKFKEMGFSTENDFLNIMSMIQNIENKELKFSYVSFEMNTIKNLNDKMTVEISLKFTDVNEIRLNLEVEKDYQSEEIIHISY